MRGYFESEVKVKRETYCSVPIAGFVVADGFIAEIDAQFAAHDFVVVKIPYC